MLVPPTVPPKTPHEVGQDDYFNFGSGGAYSPVSRQLPVVEHEAPVQYQPYSPRGGEDIELDNISRLNQNAFSRSKSLNRDLPPTPPVPISKDHLPLLKLKLVKQYYPYEATRTAQFHHGDSLVDSDHEKDIPVRHRPYNEPDPDQDYGTPDNNLYNPYYNPKDTHHETIEGIPPVAEDDQHVNPFANVFDDPSPRTLEDAKLRAHEKERVKLLRRKPRFHYTRLPYFTMVVTIIQVSVFIAELAKMGVLTGLPFQTKPYFNPMLGPSTYLLINMGARYVPCMQIVKGVTDDTTIQFPCPNSTTTATNVCLLSELCGMLGVPTNGSAYDPHQWYRIITPIFLHAGFLHIIFNLLLQCTMGASIERHLGTLKYAIIYLASGIAGFILGANYTPSGIALTGALGALFGVVATNILMFAYCGTKNTNLYGTKKYGLFILVMVCEIVVLFVLGLLPGMDNFLHIGGFAMGILMTVVLLPDPFFVYKYGIIAYDSTRLTWEQFCDNWNPLHNWEHKIHLRVYMWVAARVVALALACVYFGTLIDSFFNKDKNSTNNSCKWCKYINCIPVNGWCDIGNVTVETSTSSTSSNTPSSSAQPGFSTRTSVYTSTLPDQITEASATSPTATIDSSSASSLSTAALGGLKREEPTITEAFIEAIETGSPQGPEMLQQTNFQAFTQNGVIDGGDKVDGQTVNNIVPQAGGVYLVMVFLTVRFFKAKNWI